MVDFPARLVLEGVHLLLRRGWAFSLTRSWKMVVQVVDSSFFFHVRSPNFVIFQTQDPWKWWTKNLQKFIDLEGQCQNVHLGQAHQIPLNHYIKKKLVVSAKIHISWVVPLPSYSDQQDHYIFGTGFRSKPSFAKGATPDIHHVTIHFVQTLMA